MYDRTYECSVVISVCNHVPARTHTYIKTDSSIYSLLQTEITSSILAEDKTIEPEKFLAENLLSFV